MRDFIRYKLKIASKISEKKKNEMNFFDDDEEIFPFFHIVLLALSKNSHLIRDKSC